MGALYVGMPPTDRTIDVGKWGTIRCGGKCKDDYARIVELRPGVKLQHAAAVSLADLEHELRFLVKFTGTWRACSLQTALYRNDSKRFADPDKTAHTRGLAIDVSTDIDSKRLKLIKAGLAKRHWYQSRPTDEPWHWSFGIQV